MAAFKTIDDWLFFCTYIENRNRYVLDEDCSEFLTSLKETSTKRISTLESGKILYRSRIGVDEGWILKDREKLQAGDYFYRRALPPEDMGAPPSDKATEGRMNPKGIPYLYLASDIETAIAEMRPWLKEQISVGKFELSKNIRVLDTSNDKFLFKRENLTPEEVEKKIWGDINISLSRPVLKNEINIKYAPTQYITEIFKNQGLDGIIYSSSLQKSGRNYIIFDPKLFECKKANYFWLMKFSIN